MKYKRNNYKELKDSILFPPVEDAFLKTPIASNNDCTGYAVTIPMSDIEAENYESLLDVPCAASEDIKDEKTSVKKMNQKNK